MPLAFKPVLLWTDAAVWMLVAAGLAYGAAVLRSPGLRRSWRRVFSDAPALASSVVLALCLVVTLLDSVHYRAALPALAGAGPTGTTASGAAAVPASVAYDVRTRSLLDALLAGVEASREKSYSRPLAAVGFLKESTTLPDGRIVRAGPRLVHGGAHLRDPASERTADIAMRAAVGAAVGLAGVAAAAALLAWLIARRGGAAGRGHGDGSVGDGSDGSGGSSGSSGRVGGSGRDDRATGVGRRDDHEAGAGNGDHRPRLDRPGSAWPAALAAILRGETALPWRAALATLAAIALVAGPAIALMNHWHVLGTDRTGNDVFYQSLKSIRTAFVIGSLATVATLPFAVVLGIMAGYLRGWVDEAIQYFYTVLSSVPGVLLIAACVLMVQVFLDAHPEGFETGVERADVRLFLLCAVLGITGWAGLARLLRAETLKLRELEYVQAAQAFGVGAARIMARHVFPNVAHLMLIVTALDFSSLILYEAVLSYVGVGVDPTMNSFGGMINLARLEMSLDPVVWWSFAAAFGFMVALVLAANLFADGVRDAFDPRAARLWRRPVVAARRRPARQR